MSRHQTNSKHPPLLLALQCPIPAYSAVFPQWGPTPRPGSGMKLMLASASFDHLTKIWDALEGTCLFTLAGHTNAVYGNFDIL